MGVLIISGLVSFAAEASDLLAHGFELATRYGDLISDSVDLKAGGSSPFSVRVQRPLNVHNQN